MMTTKTPKPALLQAFSQPAQLSLQYHLALPSPRWALYILLPVTSPLSQLASLVWATRSFLVPS